jgi:hypothetical protein
MSKRGYYEVSRVEKTATEAEMKSASFSWAATIAGAVIFAGAAPALAQMDQKTRGTMQYLHRTLLLAEHNLASAMDQRDPPRAALVNDALSSWSVRLQGTTENNPCLEALRGLEGAAVAATFSITPVVTDDPASRFSKEMRPSDETLVGWFEGGANTFKSAMPACEEAIRTPVTPRVLSAKLPGTR